MGPAFLLTSQISDPDILGVRSRLLCLHVSQFNLCLVGNDDANFVGSLRVYTNSDDYVPYMDSCFVHESNTNPVKDPRVEGAASLQSRNMAGV